MSIYDNKTIQIIASKIQSVPAMGAVGLKLVLDFTTQQSIEVDLTEYVQQGKIDNIQCAYIDAGAANVPIDMFVEGSGQHITAQANSQGYYAVLSPNPPKFVFTAAGPVVTVFLFNSPIAGHSWRTS